MTERTRFIVAGPAGDDTMAEVCRRVGSSRTTGSQLYLHLPVPSLARLQERGDESA